MTALSLALSPPVEPAETPMDCLPPTLLFRLRLQLFQYETHQRSDPAIIEHELELLRGAHPIWPAVTMNGGFEDTVFGEVSPETAFELHRCAHYLGSPRKALVHMGLMQSATQQLLNLFSFSPFDLGHLTLYLPDGIEPDQVLVLSRMVGCEGAPANALSRGLGCCFAELRREYPHIRLLLTYLDPNLGFSGAVYRATNWYLVGDERKKRYLYLDGRYVTDRVMIDRFGTADPDVLIDLLGARLTTSKGELKPLRVLGYVLQKCDRRKLKPMGGQLIFPNKKLVGV